jgi:hypothetical protein
MLRSVDLYAGELLTRRWEQKCHSKWIRFNRKRVDGLGSEGVAAQIDDGFFGLRSASSLDGVFGLFLQGDSRLGFPDAGRKQTLTRPGGALCNDSGANAAGIGGG